MQQQEFCWEKWDYEKKTGCITGTHRGVRGLELEVDMYHLL
jgi:hypothetical protein